ncbi:MAG: DUF4403 family protein [Bacteroidetes bacterium]|nr:DUF4403 family protein [Bacteroidota bacterium]
MITILVSISLRRIPMLLLTCLGLAFWSCKSLDPNAKLPLPTVPQGNSSVNVPVDIPIVTLSTLANNSVPSNVISLKAVDLGNGIQGDFDFIRAGTIQLMPLDSQRLEVVFPLKIQGELGLKPGRIGNLLQSKIPFTRTLAPVMVINPEIQPNWYLGVSEFEVVDLGGKLAISAMGLEFDLSPMVRNEIRNFAKQNITSKPDLIPLKPLMESIWNEVGQPMLVEMEGTKMGLSIRPESLHLREYLRPNKGLHVDLGMKGKVELHPANAIPKKPYPLPKISSNTDASNSIDLHVPFHLTYADLDALIKKSFGGKVFRINKQYVFEAKNMSTQAYGDKLGITVDFIATPSKGNPMSGEMFLVGRPVFDESSQVLLFEELDFVMKSTSAKAKLGALLKQGKIHRQLNQQMKLPLGETLAAGVKEIQERFSLKTSIATVDILDLKMIPVGFYPTATGLAIPLRATAKTSIRWK